MTVTAPNCWSETDEKTIREQLDRIVNSGPFAQSRRRQRFLEFTVTETLAGRGERLKGYTIGLEVFDRPETFDPVVDPLVRIEAARLREKLHEYYDTEGRDDPVRIELPKGSYTPRIEFREAVRLVPSTLSLDTAAPDQGPRQGPVPPTAERPEARPSSRRSVVIPIGWKQLGMLAAAVLAIIAAGLWGLHSWTTGPSLPDKPSIAVLPFDNIGNDPQWERLADGLTEDIIADLAHSKDLIAIARNSTAVYKGKPIDIRQIGRDLNVKYVLEGSIQSMGDQIRVTAQLIDAVSGSQVWSERYDRPVEDLFKVQNEVTQRIAATLGGWQGAVAEAERRLLRRKPPANLSAFDAYLLGIEAKHKVTKESLIEAEGLFRKALQLDPQLARAYVGLVYVYIYSIDLGLAPSVGEALAKMMEAAQKAVMLDPNDGRALGALGTAYAYHGKPEQALAEFDRAEALAPSDADLLICIAWINPL